MCRFSFLFNIYLRERGGVKGREMSRKGEREKKREREGGRGEREEKERKGGRERDSMFDFCVSILREEKSQLELKIILTCDGIV